MDVAIAVNLGAEKALIDAEELFVRLQNVEKIVSSLSLSGTFAGQITGAASAATAWANALTIANRAIQQLDQYIAAAGVTTQSTTASINQNSVAVLQNA